jgi:hypothetical protein
VAGGDQEHPRIGIRIIDKLNPADLAAVVFTREKQELAGLHGRSRAPASGDRDL